MSFPVRIAGPAVAACLLLAACGSSAKSTNSTQAVQPAANTTSASSDMVKTAPTSLGTVLVDANGMTLYHLSAEQAGKFICTSSGCTGVWHPLTVTAGTTPSGAVGSLGTVKRPEGTTQVTYKGAPLYTFAEDHQAGETNGQGIKDVGTWTVVTTGAAASDSASSAPASESSGSSGGVLGRWLLRRRLLGRRLLGRRWRLQVLIPAAAAARRRQETRAARRGGPLRRPEPGPAALYGVRNVGTTDCVLCRSDYRPAGSGEVRRSRMQALSWGPTPIPG